MIKNNKPIIAPDFDGLWVSSCVITFPTAGSIDRTLKPYNGVDVLNRELDTKTTPIPAGEVDTILSQMESWLQEHFNNPYSVTVVQVDAPYPDKPVVAYVGFQQGNGTIPDCYALFKEDVKFAELFVQVMNLLSA